MKKDEMILALTTNHDTGAVGYRPDNNSIISNIFYINEERLNRKKYSRSYPSKSIDKTLEYFNKNHQMKSKVLIGSEFTPTVFFKMINPFYSRFKLDNQFSFFLDLYIIYQIIVKNSTLLRKLEISISKSFYSKKLNIDRKDIIFLEHHECHASSAHYTSGFVKSLILTVDMMGDGITLSVSKGEKNKIKRIYSQNGFSDIGLFYSRITQILGFVPNRHEGKITGLAAYGKTNDKLLRFMKGFFKFDDNTGGFTSKHIRKSRFRKLLRFDKKDIASAAQSHLENEVCSFAKFWIKKTGLQNLCLAGGLFANVKLNQQLHELPEVENIYIFPHMGDGGLAMGALLAYLEPKPFMLENVYKGPRYTNKDIQNAIKDYHHVYHPNIERKIAELLSKGYVVARFYGRMEFGPRALGNRSILYQATDKTVNNWLNKKLKRTEFMPFAPSVIEEYAEKCFKKIKGAEMAAKYMTITFQCTDYMKKTCKGVIHIDGTARPQIVAEKDNPSYYKILRYYHDITGIPAIINTSFNMHEEPIVCSPDDAVKAFKDGNLDYLAIGNYLLKKTKNNSKIKIEDEKD